MGKLAGIARREKKRAPMESLESAEITLAAGVTGDFRGKPGKRQVTLLSSSDWQIACEEVGADLPWTTRRSNLLVEGIELPREPGTIIAIGNVRLRSTREIDPCFRMDEQKQGLTKALQPDWRGGIGCEVLSGGKISIGDSVNIVDEES